MKVALCVIATGKYAQFLYELLGTAHTLFCPGHDLRFFVFTDTGMVPRHHEPTVVIPTPHESWPGPTIHRYRTMLRAEKELLACDYAYYVDVDSRFVRPVGDEVLGDLVATIHFGYAEKPRQDWT